MIRCMQTIWFTEVLGNLDLHIWFATTLSKRSFVLAVPNRLLFQVYGYPIKPKSTKLQCSKAARKASNCRGRAGLQLSFFDEFNI